jgi:hypothetical protein
MPRKPIVDDAKLSVLQQRLEKAQRDLKRAKSAQEDEARRLDARRKIIAGALALEHLEKNPGSEFGKTLFALLDEYTRPAERVLFEFLPVRVAPPAPSQDNTDGGVKPDQVEAAE